MGNCLACLKSEPNKTDANGQDSALEVTGGAVVGIPVVCAEIAERSGTSTLFRFKTF